MTTINNDLFLKLWRNVVIKNEILLHLKIYDLNSTKLFEINNVSDIVEYRNYPQKEYITSMVLKKINFNGKDENELLKQFTNGFIPNNITHLSICCDDYSSFKITNQTFPYGLKHLSLVNYNLPIPPNVLPQSLTRLNIPKTCKSKIDIGTLPNGLLILEIGNQDTTTTTINNDEVSILPSSLHSIYFNFGYNRLFNSNSFSSCNSLTYLNFSATIGQTLSVNWLPATLLKLIIISRYIDSSPTKIKSLPNSIKVFKTNGSLTSDNDNVYQLPDSLKNFTYEGTLKGISLPNTLKKLKYKGYTSSLDLPIGLKKLTLDCYTIKNLIYPISLIKLSKIISIGQLVNLPQSIEILKFGYNFTSVIPVGLLSNLNSLKSVIFNQGSPYFDRSDGIIFPKSLKHLENISNLKLKSLIGISLKTLILPRKFIQFNDNYKPNFDTLQSLKFCTDYPFELPQSLTLLDLEGTSSKELTITGLPKSLTTLIIRNGDNIIFPVSSITTSLKSIVFIKPGKNSVVYELIKIPEFFKIIHIIQNSPNRDKIFQKKVKSLQ